jgi:hypothetical protein
VRNQPVLDSETDSFCAQIHLAKARPSPGREEKAEDEARDAG